MSTPGAVTSAGLVLVATVALLGAARRSNDHTIGGVGGSWVLQVEDSAGWRTWWDAETAPEVWQAPVKLVLDATRWTPLARGADLGELVVSSGSLALRTRIVLGRFDPRHYRIEVVGKPSLPARPPAWTIDSADAGAVLAFNGGQFVPSGPWGWLVRDGREVQPPAWGPLSMAVANTRNGDTRFVSPDSVARFRETEAVEQAFQSYPALLVADGRVPFRLQESGGPVNLGHRDTRLAICALRDGRLLVALTRFDNLGRIFGGLPIGFTLGEMGAVMGALGCRRAVSLDGGFSAQLLARPLDGSVARWAGQRPVPLGIEVRPR